MIEVVRRALLWSAVGMLSVLCRADAVDVRQRQRVDDTQTYFSFVINCHDFVNVNDSADTLLRLISLFETRAIRGDFYVTAPLVEAYLRDRPDVIEQLKATGQTISYHLRPPHPVCHPGALSAELRGLAHEELLSRLEAYETRGWDMTTGLPRDEGEGGYALVRRVFGAAPVALGLNPVSPELRRASAEVLRKMGARMAVFSHEGGSDATYPFVWHHGVLERPSDFSVTRAGPPGRQTDFWWNHVGEGERYDPVFQLTMALSRLTPHRIHFAQALIHENNFYLRGTPWAPIYYGGPGPRGGPLPPPYDLSRAAGAVPLRAKPESDAIWATYERLLDAVAANRQIKVVTSADVVNMVEPCPDPRAGTLPAVRKAPREVTWAQPETTSRQWLSDPDFEERSDAWQAPQGPDVARYVGDIAHEGATSLMVEAAREMPPALIQQVRLERGRWYRVGGWVKGEDVGSIVLRLELVPGGRARGAEPIATMPLGGTFDWQRIETEALVAGNVRMAELHVIARGGKVWVDDLYVESEEPAMAEIPAEPRGELLVGYLVHIEDQPQLVTDEGVFRAKSRIIEELARLYHDNGAIMTLQPELEVVRGAARYDPDWVRRLHGEYGVEFSVHTHGPKMPRPTTDDVLAYVAERKRAFEEAGSGPVTDLNGNFDMDDFDALAGIGILSQTAFKNKYTQCPSGRLYTRPWRLGKATAFVDEVAWAEHHPAGKVLYIPGQGDVLSREHAYAPQLTRASLARALNRCEPDEVNAWYFMGHVDTFVPHRPGTSLTEYVASDDFGDDLRHYERMLQEVFRPLAEKGYIRWATPSQMREAFEEWERRQ